MKSHLRRLLTLPTLLCFLTQLLGPPPPALSAIALVPPSEIPSPPGEQLTLPPGLGTIEKSISGTGPFIIQIQTAHGNYEAQKKIQAILHYLKQHHDIRLLLLEGSAFKLHPERLILFPQQETNQKALDHLTKRALVKGPELFLSEAPGIEAYGIEEINAYVQNGDDFRTILAHQEQMQNFLTKIELQLEKLVAVHFSKELRTFLNRQKDFDARHLPLPEWLNDLAKQAQRNLKVNLADPAWQIDWPMFYRILTLKALEEKIDAQALPIERQSFLNTLRPRLSEEIFKPAAALLEAPLSHHQLQDPQTSLLFEQMVRELSADFDFNEWPNVKRLIGHLILQSELKGDRLFEEMERLTERILNQLTRTETEKTLLDLYRDIRLLEKLLGLDVTPLDFQHIELRIQHNAGIQPSEIVERLHQQNRDGRVGPLESPLPAGLDALFETALRFYRETRVRDDWMLKNIEARLRESGETKAVVITGGFHAGPFADYFEQKGYGYALITPNISVIEDRDAYSASLLRYQLAPGRESTYETIPFLATLPEEMKQLGYDPDKFRQDLEQLIPPLRAHRETVPREEPEEVPMPETVPAEPEPAPAPVEPDEEPAPYEPEEEPEPAPYEPEEEPFTPDEEPKPATEPAEVPEKEPVPAGARSEAREVPSYLVKKLVEIIGADHESTITLALQSIAGAYPSYNPRYPDMLFDPLYKLIDINFFAEQGLEKLEQIASVAADKQAPFPELLNVLHSLPPKKLIPFIKLVRNIRPLHGSYDALKVVHIMIKKNILTEEDEDSFLVAETFLIEIAKATERDAPNAFRAITALIENGVIDRNDIKAADQLTNTFRKIPLATKHFPVSGTVFMYMVGLANKGFFKIEPYEKMNKLIELSETSVLHAIPAAWIISLVELNNQGLFNQNSLTRLETLISISKTSKYFGTETFESITRLGSQGVFADQADEKLQAILKNLTLFISRFGIDAIPYLEDYAYILDFNVEETKKQFLEKLKLSHLAFLNGLEHAEANALPLDSIITLGTKIGAGSKEKSIGPASSSPENIADWIIQQRFTAGNEIQVAVGFDTGALPAQEHRAKFIAAFLFIASSNLGEFRALSLRPRRDPRAAYGLLIRGDHMEKKIPGQQAGRRLDYIFNLSADMLLGERANSNLTTLLRQIQLLNLGMLIAAAEENYRLFIPEKPEWLDARAQAIAARYRQFERDLIRQLRHYDRFRDPDSIIPSKNNPELNQVWKNASMKHRHEEALYPIYPWLQPLYEPDQYWHTLLPLLRTTEGTLRSRKASDKIVKNPQTGKEERRPVARQFKIDIAQLGYEAMNDIEAILKAETVEEVPEETLFDPFLDDEEPEATRDYLQATADALVQGRLSKTVLPDVSAYDDFVQRYEIVGRSEARSLLAPDAVAPVALLDIEAHRETVPREEPEEVPMPETVPAEPEPAPAPVEPDEEPVPYEPEEEPATAPEEEPEPAASLETRTFFTLAARTLPLRYFERFSLESLVTLLSELLGRPAYAERAGMVPVTPDSRLDQTLGAGPYETTEAFDEQLETLLEDAGHVLIDQPWIENLLEKNPRALYLLLNTLSRLQSSQAEKKPLIAIASNEDLHDRIWHALVDKPAPGLGNTLTSRERAEAQQNLDKARLQELIEVVPVAETETYVRNQDYAVATLISSPTSELAAKAGAQFLLMPELLHENDLITFVFLQPALLKAAKEVRGISNRYQQAERLKRSIQDIFPGALPEGNGFIIQIQQYIDEVLIQSRLIRTSA